MDYQILVDSCGDFTDKMKLSENVIPIALKIHIDGEELTDDETLDIPVFMEKIEHSVTCPHSSCPSPAQYMESCDVSVERTYIITGSSSLTGSYNSACLARDMIREDNPKAKICVIDSKSASAGQALLTMKIIEWEEGKVDFSEIKRRIMLHRQKMKTRFVLESLKMLEKSGRLGGLKAKVAQALHILPVLGGTGEGTIEQTGQARGIKKAMSVLIKQIMADCGNDMPERIVISQCRCPERALDLKNKLLEKYPGLEILILPTKGISSMYAGNGGIVVAY